MRTTKEIMAEIGKVSSAQVAAERKTVRCMERMKELREELAEAEAKEKEK